MWSSQARGVECAVSSLWPVYPHLHWAEALVRGRKNVKRQSKNSIHLFTSKENNCWGTHPRNVMLLYQFHQQLARSLHRNFWKSIKNDTKCLEDYFIYILNTQTSFIEISIEAGILRSGKGAIQDSVGLLNAVVFLAQNWYGISVSSLRMQLSQWLITAVVS